MSETILGILTFAFGLTHLAPVAGAVSYVKGERKYRQEWQAFALPAAVVDHSAYRSSGAIVVGHVERAPTLVRVAAASSIMFGSMFLPGLAWGLFGILAMGSGLLSIPGLLIAASLWGAGHALLRGTRESAVSAARIASASIYFNLFLVVGACAVVTLARDEGALWLSALVGGYACLSLVQAAILVKAARRVATFHGDDFEGVVDSHLPAALRHLLNRKRARLVAAG